ncbi:hypothetical protein O181_011059 [Austropuccinia psidii MF-1]|uniref:Integrase catalytic domain-containing protein n=1 Tax=Austropuccinia psidii MF-1 TaxID=1389203 RepID=A0A9Q3BS76_9BASI|nr:hypothetical protein [Austropuccinia psidii MF-1]
MVVYNKKAQKQILKRMHEELGHKGENETYRRIKKRYWWEGMKMTIKKWVKSCQEFQKGSHLQQKEEAKISVTSNLSERVSMDAIHIKAGRCKYLVIERDDLSGWAETVALTRLTAKSVSEWICRYGAQKEVTVDGGSEFGKELQEAVKREGSIIRVTTPYYPESQGMVERGYKQLKDALVKMCGENGSTWKEYLPIQALLPIDIETNTYLAIELNKISTIEELLEVRTIHIAAKEETRLAAAEKLRDSRHKPVQYLDKTMAHRLRNPLEPGDLVLVSNKPLKSQWGLLFKNCWTVPYRVINKVNNGPYELEELDGTKCTRKFAASHIKKFYPRGEIVQSSSESENEISGEIEAEDSILPEGEIEKNGYD